MLEQAPTKRCSAGANIYIPSLKYLQGLAKAAIAIVLIFIKTRLSKPSLISPLTA